MTADLFGRTPFSDDDATIARMLEDVSVPALVCSMVHITGDVRWIREGVRPHGLFLNEVQGYLSDAEQAEIRARALAAIVEFRDGGCELPPPPADDVIHEMMNWLVCERVPDEYVPMMLEELELDGADHRRVDWSRVDADTLSDLPVVVIGCGMSGVLAGVRLAEAGLPFTIIEKNDGPGGTWYENRYPGARVDVGNHFYCYSFEPSDHWTEFFSRQPELQAYFERTVERHGFADRVRWGTEVTAARWTGDAWSVETRMPDGSIATIEARAVIAAVGQLNRPKIPDIPGRDTFAGEQWHSARWRHDVDLAGRRVALVGAGASGFQIAPAIADAVGHLDVFQRTAQWMFPNPHYHEATGEGVGWAVRHLPYYGRWYRFLLFWPACDGGMAAATIDPDWDDGDRSVSAVNDMARQMFTQWITDQVGDDPELLAKCVPDYPATGKRTLQDNGSWLQTLRRPDVDLHRTPIDRIEPDAIVTVDGARHPVDVIVWATGFHGDRFLWPMDIVGRDGVVLAEQWADGASGLLGITVPNFPNLFMMYGPGTNLASGGSIIFHAECQMRYIEGCLRLLAAGHGTIEPRADVAADYFERAQAQLDRMVWSHPSIEHSWYKSGDGRIYGLSPWRLVDYWDWTRAPDPHEFVFD